MRKIYAANTIEKIGTTVDGVRLWFSKAWRIGVLMAKGAYLLAERRRLFVKLGEDVYHKSLRGELKNPDFEPLVSQLERLTKKVEIEEMLIRTLRFGKERRKADTEAPPPKEEAQ